MVVTIDIGNTDAVSVLYDEEGNTVRYARVSLKKSKLKEDPELFVLNLIRTWHLEDCNYIVSCVVPKLVLELSAALKKHFKRDGIFVDYRSYPGISDGLKYPAEIGADLVSASVAVIDNDKPSIVVDMGSASKIILVKDKKLVSAAIMLGVKNNMLALNQSIKHLPHVELNFPAEILGKDTVESIQSGLMYSTLYAIKGFVTALEEKLGVTANKYLTGGIGNLFVDHLEGFTHTPNLVNDGLFKIYKLNEGDIK